MFVSGPYRGIDAQGLPCRVLWPSHARKIICMRTATGLLRCILSMRMYGSGGASLAHGQMLEQGLYLSMRCAEWCKVADSVQENALQTGHTGGYSTGQCQFYGASS